MDSAEALRGRGCVRFIGFILAPNSSSELYSFSSFVPLVDVGASEHDEHYRIQLILI